MRRWPIVAASAYALLVAVGLFVVPAAPGVTASGQELVRHLTRHADGLRLVAWLGAVSLIPLVLLVARLRQVVDGIGRDVLLFGSVGLVASTTVWVWFGAGLALHPSALQPATARAMADVSAYFGPVLTVAVLLMAAPVGVAAWRGTGNLPRWLAWVSGAVVAEQVVESFTVFGRSGAFAPGGLLNMDVGPALFLIWIVSAGVGASPATAARTRPVDQPPDPGPVIASARSTQAPV